MSQHCLLPAGRLPYQCSLFTSLSALDFRSPLPSSPVQVAWRLLEPHATGTFLKSGLTAIHADIMVPRSLHIP